MVAWAFNSIRETRSPDGRELAVAREHYPKRGN
jgi:hypothetical protein